MSRLSLDHLETFAHVIALGSFSAAAQRLKLSQPAISLQMKQLEGRLGVRLRRCPSHGAAKSELAAQRNRAFALAKASSEIGSRLAPRQTSPAGAARGDRRHQRVRSRLCGEVAEARLPLVCVGPPSAQRERLVGRFS